MFVIKTTCTYHIIYYYIIIFDVPCTSSSSCVCARSDSICSNAHAHIRTFTRGLKRALPLCTTTNQQVSQIRQHLPQHIHKRT